MATECQEPLGTQSHVAAEGGGIEGDFEAVVVAFATDEGNDVVRPPVALHLKKEGGCVEGDGEGISRDGADKCGWGGIDLPIEGIDGHLVALTYHGYGATVVTD